MAGLAGGLAGLGWAVGWAGWARLVSALAGQAGGQAGWAGLVAGLAVPGVAAVGLYAYIGLDINDAYKTYTDHTDPHLANNIVDPPNVS